MRFSAFLLTYCLKGLFTDSLFAHSGLLCKQFLEFAIQGLAHGTVTH